MKSTNSKEHGSALTKLQKFLTFIGSILGIITACITIYTFTAKSTVLPILTLIHLQQLAQPSLYKYQQVLVLKRQLLAKPKLALQ